MPVPGGDGDEDLDMPHYPDEDGGHPPGGGPQGPGPGYGPSPDEPDLPMEYHEESPPPGEFTKVLHLGTLLCRFVKINPL